MHGLGDHLIQRKSRALLSLLSLALSAAACSSATSGGAGSTGGSGGGSPASVCASDPRAQAYAVGLEGKAADGAMKIRFMDAMPAPPAKGNNTWTIQVLDGADKPIDGATIELKAFMPDHGHGSSTKPTITPMGSGGAYQLSLVNLFMPGIWQVTFNVQPAGGQADAVVFTFCVDG